MITAGVVFAVSTSLSVCAQGISEVEVSTSCSCLPVKGISESTDGIYNFKNFEIEALQEGAYYTEFWLQPARYAGNRYTSFRVYVNGEYIGSIDPSCGNWQSACVDNREMLELEKGKNVISVATMAPEFPDVETLKVSLNRNDASFCPDAYEEYLDEAMAGNVYNVPETENGITMLSASEATAGMAFFTNIPLRYSFYKFYSFTQNQEIFITSSSVTEHIIDVIYVGIPFEVNRPGISPSPFFKFFYARASSEEMQGLNWKGISEKAINSSTQVATVRLNIPKSGLYLVRLRSVENGVLSVADLNVNGAYYYEDAPIFYAGVNCEIPADGNEYASMTNCFSADEDDPMIFIHGGGDADRIVGFNDDGPSDKLQQYNLSVRDSYISQKYFIRTNGISVSNFSAYSPVSRCNILARVAESSSQAAARMMVQNSETGALSVDVRDSSIWMPGVAELASSFLITADGEIDRISVYGMSGECLGTVSGKGTSMPVSLSDLNVFLPGIYLVCVETVNGQSSQKVIVR